MKLFSLNKIDRLYRQGGEIKIFTFKKDNIPKVKKNLTFKRLQDQILHATVIISVS